MAKQFIFTKFILILFALLCTDLIAREISFSSPESRVTLLELYTSEGCSSCPPADRWLSRFRESELLWNEVIPVAFHVDYWDWLGWKDKYADQRFSQRQYNYKTLNYVSAVYTPGMFKNGREWRGWRRNHSAKSNENKKPGILSATIDETRMTVVFKPSKQTNRSFLLNIAVLGAGIRSKIKAGENSGETLIHNFVVLDFQQEPLSNDANNLIWEMQSPLLSMPKETKALAIWLSRVGDPTPIQATGTWLP